MVVTVCTQLDFIQLHEGTFVNHLHQNVSVGGSWGVGVEVEVGVASHWHDLFKQGDHRRWESACVLTVKKVTRTRACNGPATEIVSNEKA